MKLLALTLLLTLPFATHAQDAKPTTPAAVQNVTPEETQKILAQKKEVVILDVRTPEEFQDGHIAGAKNLNFQAPDFKQKLAELDKSKEYVVHCQAGGRSGKAVKLMQQMGFDKVDHMDGGMSAWKGDGKPVEK